MNDIELENQTNRVREMLAAVARETWAPPALSPEEQAAYEARRAARLAAETNAE